MSGDYEHLKLVKEVKNPSDVPSQPHFQITIFEDCYISHEGDERSRTNPGHGYPAYTETIHKKNVYVTTERNSWIIALQGLYRINPLRKDIVATEVTRVANISFNVTIS